MKNKEQALAILEKALAATTVEGCDAADAALWCTRRALTRFANNIIHQNVATESDTLCLRAVRGKRTGCVRTGVLTDEGIGVAAKKAAAIAAASPEDPEFPGIIGNPTAEPCGVFDDATANCTPGQRAEAVREIIGVIEGGGAVASGALSTSATHLAAANTAGTQQFDRQTEVSLSIVAMDGTAAGCGEFTSARLGEMDAKERAELALKKCLDSRGAGDLEPGEYTVVLEPAAAAELFDFLAYLGLGAQAMQQDQSCLQGKLGEKVFDERITLIDDPHDPACEPFAFDGEGVPTQRVELIAEGVFKNIVYDNKTAKKDGVKSTGNGNVPPGTYGPFPSTMLIAPGDATLDEMIASTQHGLLVSNFHYTNVAERSTCAITGMTRYGLFEIVDGKIARPVKNLRFTQSVLAALNDVAAIGKDRERSGSTLVPALKINTFRFTGKSDH
jgi:PmbA protein